MKEVVPCGGEIGAGRGGFCTSSSPESLRTDPDIFRAGGAKLRDLLHLLQIIYLSCYYILNVMIFPCNCLKPLMPICMHL